MKAFAYLLIFIIVSVITYGIFALCNWSYVVSDWPEGAGGGLGTILVCYLIGCSVVFVLKKEDEL